jgi:hypothetical protein
MPTVLETKDVAKNQGFWDACGVGLERWLAGTLHPPCSTCAELKPFRRHELGHHHLGDDRIRLPHPASLLQ